MTFKGFLLKESLQDTSVLDSLEITNTETIPCPEHMKAAYIPDVWTGCEFVGDASKADVTAEKLSKVLKYGWFIDMDTETHNYLIFRNKVVKYVCEGERGIEGQLWPEEAKQAAREAGVPAFVK